MNHNIYIELCNLYELYTHHHSFSIVHLGSSVFVWPFFSIHLWNALLLFNKLLFESPKNRFKVNKNKRFTWLMTCRLTPKIPVLFSQTIVKWPVLAFCTLPPHTHTHIRLSSTYILKFSSLWNAKQSVYLCACAFDNIASE